MKTKNRVQGRRTFTKCPETGLLLNANAVLCPVDVKKRTLSTADYQVDEKTKNNNDLIH